MADVKPYILFLIIILTDVIFKVADVMATYVATRWILVKACLTAKNIVLFKRNL